MIGDAWEWTASTRSGGYPGFRAFPYPRVRRGLLRPALPRAARRLVGHPADRRPGHLPELGPAPSGARSSPGCAGQGRRVSAGVDLPRPFRLDVHPAGAAGGLADDARDGPAPPRRRRCRPSTSTTRAAPSCSSGSRGCPSTTRRAAERGSCAACADGWSPPRRGELVELGSGASRKTARCSTRCARGTAGALRALRRATRRSLRCARRLVEDYPGLEVHGVVGRLRPPPRRAVPAEGGAARLVAFLGGTIGNLEPAERAAVPRLGRPR